MAELVAGIGLRQRLGANRDHLPAEQLGETRAIRIRNIEPQLLRQRLVEADQLRCAGGGRFCRSVEALRQAGVSVVEGKQRGTPGPAAGRTMSWA